MTGVTDVIDAASFCAREHSGPAVTSDPTDLVRLDPRLPVFAL